MFVDPVPRCSEEPWVMKVVAPTPRHEPGHVGLEGGGVRRGRSYGEATPFAWYRS